MATSSIKSRTRSTSIRLSESEHGAIKAEARRLGFRSIGEYLRMLHAESIKGTANEPPAPSYPVPEMAIQRGLGAVFEGDSRGLLHHELEPGSVDLIMTSPPFGLVRQKAYRNEDADRYVDWFRPFAEGMRRVLKEDGSLVIDIGGAWQKGQPTRSLYHFKLLIALCEDYGFHLCQEHYWWNPAKLPTPAEWVNIRRVRVKDAVNCVWWLSPSPWPRANNRRVLAPYSPSMKKLLKNGYQPRLRPSGHDISNKFQRDNGGAVPPNLLAIANTRSTGPYERYCQQHGLPIHPARFPAELPEYFIRFLTDEGDLVVDPFAGSGLTGAVAERLKRRWVCCELDPSYVAGAHGYFENDFVSSKDGGCTYSIPAPLSGPVVVDADVPLSTGTSR